MFCCTSDQDIGAECRELRTSKQQFCITKEHQELLRNEFSDAISIRSRKGMLPGLCVTHVADEACDNCDSGRVSGVL